jgi:alpha-D-ribose 1-methylphosphonate 5-triphosphate synthase subunit PhnI
MYVAVKGGEQAIDNAHRLLAKKRRGDTSVTELSVEQIRQQLPLAVARVMSEGSLYDEELAALAIKQAAGDLVEAIFLLRAYRTTLPRFSPSLPIDTQNMQLSRRLSATFKDVPGGQLLGPTFDYTHRLLDFALLAEGEYPGPQTTPNASLEPCPSEVPYVRGETFWFLLWRLTKGTRRKGETISSRYRSNGYVHHQKRRPKRSPLNVTARTAAPTPQAPHEYPSLPKALSD